MHQVLLPFFFFPTPIFFYSPWLNFAKRASLLLFIEIVWALNCANSLTFYTFRMRIIKVLTWLKGRGVSIEPAGRVRGSLNGPAAGRPRSLLPPLLPPPPSFHKSKEIRGNAELFQDTRGLLKWIKISKSLFFLHFLSNTITMLVTCDNVVVNFGRRFQTSTLIKLT